MTRKKKITAEELETRLTPFRGSVTFQEDPNAPVDAEWRRYLASDGPIVCLFPSEGDPHQLLRLVAKHWQLPSASRWCCAVHGPQPMGTGFLQCPACVQAGIGRCRDGTTQHALVLVYNGEPVDPSCDRLIRRLGGRPPADAWSIADVEAIAMEAKLRLGCEVVR